MAVSIDATDAGIIFPTGTSRTISYTHASGTDLLVVIGARVNSVTLSSVTYNAVSMSLIVASTQGGADAGVIMAAYRLNDPGSITADLVVNYPSSGFVGLGVYIIDVSGCPTTSPVDSSDSVANASGSPINTTYTRIDSDTFSIIAGVRGRATTAISFTPNDGATEVFDTDGINNTCSMTLATLQETVNGSLTRGVTAPIGGKNAGLCVSYKTLVPGHPAIKRLAGNRYASRYRGIR